MRKNLLNILFFLGIAVGFWFLWSYAEKNWFPRPADPRAEAKKKAEEDAKKAEEERKERERKQIAPAVAFGGLALAAEEVQVITAGAARRAAEEKLREEKKTAASAVAGSAALLFDPRPVPRDMPTLIAFGNDEFYTRFLLTTRGGGVQQGVLTKFNDADRLGREVKGAPFYIIPGVKRERPHYLRENYPIPDLKPGKVANDADLAEPSFTIFHYPDPAEKIPDPFLGETNWDIPDGYKDEQGNPKPKVLEDGRLQMVFEKELGEPFLVKFRKTYTLGPKDYHIGLKLEIEPLPGRQKGKPFRYQISGPRELPIEGEWYTSTYRVALIGWDDRKGVARQQYDTAASVAIKRGGDAVPKGENQFKYMVVRTQFFASGVAIDDEAKDGARNPWAYARATTELPFGKNPDPNMPYFDDVTVRAASDTLDPGPGEKVAHSYLLYNGPAKVRLLWLMEGDRAVDSALVERYHDKLSLKTITDFQSPTWLGSFANTIYWTDLVISFTNLMHWLLAVIHSVIPSWALSIVVLTVMVRLILHYPSKKQMAMNLKMMAIQKKLAPQFEELKKKHEGDPQGYNRAKMQLMMANGVNPFAAMGGCLLLLAQFPVMMGLYFCLQESVFFRLEPFLWIDNLAAPDMTLWWGEKIPYISAPESIGGFLYFGPYLNILPLIAVGLMIWQQNKMMPPAADEQMAAQQRMMKIMMIVVAVMFYKVAAGLALYFIVSTAWGLIERRLIPKPDEKTLAAEAAKMGDAQDGPPKPKGFIGRMLERAKERMEEMKRQADEQSKRQIRNERGGPPQGQGGGGGGGGSGGNGGGGGGGGGGQGPPKRRDDRRDKKKRRRK